MSFTREQSDEIDQQTLRCIDLDPLCHPGNIGASTFSAHSHHFNSRVVCDGGHLNQPVNYLSVEEE